MNDNTIEYRVSFRTRVPGPAKADPTEAPGDGGVDNVSGPSTPRMLRGRRNRNAESLSHGGAVRRPSPAKSARLASQLALGHLVERAIEAGTLDNYADAADRLGVTRGRISQIVALTLLAPRIQDSILAGEVDTASHALRVLLRAIDWQTQTRTLPGMPSTTPND